MWILTSEAPEFLLSSTHSIILEGVTTTGTLAWIDNASISVTTAVPEPEINLDSSVGRTISHWVNFKKAEKVNFHEHLQLKTSGQLRNLG